MCLDLGNHDRARLVSRLSLGINGNEEESTVVTMSEVAKAAGVSQAAVSYAYSRPSKVSSGQRARIFEVAEALGYHGPDAAGRSLRGGRVGAVGVMVMDSLGYAFSDPSNMQLLRGIAEEGELADVAVTLLPSPRPGPSDNKDPLGHRQASAGMRGLVDGVIIHNLPQGHAAVEAVIARGIPVVVVDSPKLRGVPYVGLDDRSAAASAAQHLLALGHRRIGILVDRLAPDGRSGVARPSRISQASDRVARARVQGYLQQLEASGIARSSVPVIEAGGFQPEDYAKATGQLLDDYDVTAILVASDVMALEAMSVATQRGLSVPAELSVVGFDDAPGAAEAGLTTVSQPMVEKGRIAAQLLLKAIATGELESVLLPTEFIVRSSTARPQKRRSGSR